MSSSLRDQKAFSVLFLGGVRGWLQLLYYRETGVFKLDDGLICVYAHMLHICVCLCMCVATYNPF